MSFKNYKAFALTALALAVFNLTARNEAASAEDKKVVAQTEVSGESKDATTVTKDSPFEERASYAFGASIGMYVANMQKNQADIVGPLSNELIIKGFIEAMNDKSQLDQATIESTLMALNEKAQEAMLAKAAAEAKANLDAGEMFLAENKAKEGVKVTDSGLQYKVIKEGKGKKPTSGDIISVKYKGTTIDGQVFDEQTEPVDFPLDNMIQGWVEGLALMSEGSTYELYIPSALGYGEQGAGDLIKPNSVLIFNVELVAVKSAQDNATQESNTTSAK